MEPDMDIAPGFTEEKQTRWLTKRTLYGGAAIVAVVLAAAYFIFFRSAKGDEAAKAQQEARQEAEQLVVAVGKLMVLPTEQPIIATVEDPTQLAGQPFFQNAKKGDKVLIYNEARKAVLYRPDTNLIIDVAPLSIAGSPSPVPKQ